MRVIVVTDYAYVNGGAGKVALESAIALAGRVDHVHVFSAIGEISASLVGVENLTVSSLHQKKVTELPLVEGATKGLLNRTAATEFAVLLDSYDPQDTVIHVHSWRDALTMSLLAPAMAKGFKVLVTMHDYGLACPIAGFFDERKGGICDARGMSTQCICKSCTAGSFLKKSWFVARHGVQVYRSHAPSSIKHFISVSPFSEQIMRPYLPEGANVYSVQNPIHVQRGERAEAEKNASYLFVGRFSPEKGPEIFASATHRIGVNATFVGAGPLEDSIREGNPDAELLGWRKPEEVKVIMSKSRALVFPSIWYETQGMVVDEAAALGLPVIVSDCTAAVDTTNRLGHGSIFRAGDTDALVRRLQEFSNDDIVERYSKTGFERYWDNPSTIFTHVSRLLEVYSEVLLS